MKKMQFSFLLLCSLLVSLQYVSCFYNLCHSRKNDFLSDDECADLYFEPTEKETQLGQLDVRLENDSLIITPQGRSWNNAYLRVTIYNNKSNQFCNKLSPGSVSKFCIEFLPDTKNDTFLLEYKAEKLPETSSRKFIVTLPQPEAYLFPYVDLTDTSRLVLKSQKFPTSINVTFYKIEAFKEKNNITRLLDVRLFHSLEEISYEIFTYNDEGEYYFIISVLSDSCEGEVCWRISTPAIYIGRKSTRLVIGIVGASFILPFVLFLFHILTKKYPIEESRLEGGIVVAYKSSSKKHNEVVVALAALLEQLNRNQAVEVVDLSKSAKKFPEKFCVDTLITTTRVVYVAPPRNETQTVAVDKALAQKEVLAVVFDHCTVKMPGFFENHKIFRLLEDLDKFLTALGVDVAYENHPLYADLRKKTEEARIEVDRNSKLDDLPKIVVTVDELQEHDSLISPEIV